MYNAKNNKTINNKTINNKTINNKTINNTNNKTMDNNIVNNKSNTSNMHNYKITISYDGMPYKGWQRLSDNNSIQDILESAVSKYLGTDTTITGSGRTDAGVSAIAQIANFHTCT